MSQPKFTRCAFDPACCPLLQGLTEEEQQRRMATDPLIRACVSGVEAGAGYPQQCLPSEPPGVAGRKRLRRTAAAES